MFLNQGIPTILSEPMVDDIYKEEYPVSVGAKIFAIEFYLVNMIKEPMLVNNVFSY
ncbi:MAG: hypothetical protein ACLTMR_00605 [Faecalibacillus sp.]